jgi:hypothetical protein
MRGASRGVPIGRPRRSVRDGRSAAPPTLVRALSPFPRARSTPRGAHRQECASAVPGVWPARGRGPNGGPLSSGHLEALGRLRGLGTPSAAPLKSVAPCSAGQPVWGVDNARLGLGADIRHRPTGPGRPVRRRVRVLAPPCARASRAAPAPSPPPPNGSASASRMRNETTSRAEPRPRIASANPSRASSSAAGAIVVVRGDDTSPKGVVGASRGRPQGNRTSWSRIAGGEILAVPRGRREAGGRRWSRAGTRASAGTSRR